MATTPGAPERRQTTLYSPALRKLKALSGIGFALLLIATIAASGDVPDHGDPLSDWTQYAQDDGDGLRLGAVLFAFATYQFVLFLSTLRSYLGGFEERTPEVTSGRYAVLAGGIIGITGMMIGVTMSAVAVLHPDSPEVVRGVSDAAGGAFTAMSPGFAVMLIATYIVSSATGALPKWLNYVALATGIFFLLQVFTLLSDESDNAFGIFYPLSFLGLVIFTIGASLFDYRKVSAETQTTTATT